MVEMPMMPTQPTAEPIVSGDGGAVADAPQGAFEEMLARRLGRQLVGKYASEDGDSDGDATGGGEPHQWIPSPSATAEPGHQSTGSASHPVAVPLPAGGPSLLDTTPPATQEAPAPPPVRMTVAVDAGNAPIKLVVNRPGFRVPMAEPGLIEPGPPGDIWTHPSGVADLELTSSPVDRAVTANPASEPAPEPPVVHWSPAPARAALAAAANRDLEFEIVSAMRTRLEAAPQKAHLEAVRTEPAAAVAPARPIDLDVATPDDGGVHAPVGSVPVGGAAPANGSGGAVTEATPSALIDRVVNAVELQRHLPPPRAIAVEIPEIEGLRLLVTMRMDGTVHVSTSMSGNGQLPGQAVPLLQAVNEALTERGFDMNADTGGRGRPHDRPDDGDAPQPGRLRRPLRRSGLRI